MSDDLLTMTCVIFLIFLYVFSSNKYMKEEYIILKEKETIPSFFNHTSIIGDEIKISYTVRRS